MGMNFVHCPSNFSPGCAYTPPPPGINGLTTLESGIDSQIEKISILSSEIGIPL